jgi:hypothetical protein
LSTDSIKGRAWKFWSTNLEDAEIERFSPCTNLSPRKEEEEEGSRGMGVDGVLTSFEKPSLKVQLQTITSILLLSLVKSH